MDPAMSTSSKNLFGGGILRNLLQCNVKASNENEDFNSSSNIENGETISNLTQNNNSAYGDAFQIDRNCINSVPKESQAQELHSLEVAVYDHETLEKGIIEQVDRALEKEKKDDLKKQYDFQIKSIQEDITATEKQVKNNESFLLNLPIKGFVSKVNEALLLRRDIDNGMSHIQALKSREKAVICKRKQLDENVFSKNEWEYCSDPDDVFSDKSLGLYDPEIDDQSVEHNKKTERQRMVRLGQMTPFGTTLSRDSQVKLFKKNTLSDFDKYLQSQADLQEQKNKKSVKHQDMPVSHNFALSLPGPSGVNSSNKLSKQNKGTGKLKTKSSVLKKSVLHPKKKRRKHSFGTKTSDKFVDQRSKPGPLPSETNAINLQSSGSEYLPSENEESSDEGVQVKKLKQRKKTQHRNMTVEEWGTDDSDWEYSDDEMVRRRRKRGKKVIDDGNVEDYLERLKIWESDKKTQRNEKQQRKSREDSEECSDNDFQEFDGGLKIPSKIWDKLFSFQKVGVQWMWELHQQKCGGILGDEMGLGKTIQVIAFFAGLASSPQLAHLTGWSKGLGPSLIVCPTTMLHQWVEEFHTWWSPLRVAILHDSGSFSGSGGKAALVKSVRDSAGVLVTSYEGLSRLADDLSLLDWHLIVLDEGHVIRNPDARITLAAKRLRTPHRLLLSGSPLQNNLRELWSLFDFIYPGKLGTLPVFSAEFAIPITQGGYATASQVQVVTGYKCATVLKDTIAPFLLRRMKADVKDHINLPSKNEQVLFCRLTEEQRDVYRQYLKSGDVDRILTGTMKVFVGLINLRKICNHPHLYTGGPKLLKWDNEENLPEEERYGYWNKSGKMIVVENLLRIWHRQGHRVLLFTQGRQMMCILENFIRQQGYTYLKLDGSTNISARQPLINEFNQNAFHFIFLLTTRVGGLGVNLTGANRVLIYDPDWNPATDTQARERAWRPGQLRHVTVYRLVTAGTIEEKIYHRQIFKQFLTDRVLRDPRRRRFFKSNDLYELFTLHEDGDDLGKRGAKTETSAIFAGTGSEIKVPASLPPSKRKRVAMMKEEKKMGEKMINQKQITGDAKAGMTKSSVFTSVNTRHKICNEITEINKTKNRDDVQLTATALNTENAETISTITAVNKEKREDIADVKFSKEKIEMMKKMAQNLSLKIARQVARVQTNEQKEECIPSPFKVADEGCVSSDPPPEFLSDVEKTEFIQVVPNKKNIEKEKNFSNTGLCLNDTKESKHHSRKKTKKRSKKRKECMFEGERVPHLVGYGESLSKSKSKEEEEKDAKDVSQSQDDYVLKKLFAKSGLTTALRHDVIMEGGEADYALVEGEAERVAHEAVKALKESRRNCWAASSGVPTWTGQNGRLCKNASSSLAVGKPKPLRFGNKKRQLPLETRTPEKMSTAVARPPVNSLSSTELLSHIRHKDSLLEYFRWKKRMREREQRGEGSDDSIEDHEPVSTAVTREQADLLDDIRGFVACGAARDGQATTSEILARFKDRLPPGATPQLFKSMLRSVCNFENHGPAGTGMWKLKPEFCD